MNVALEAVDVLTVIDALEAKAEQSDPLGPKCEDEVREYARFTLYDEMLGAKQCCPCNARSCRNDTL